MACVFHLVRQSPLLSLSLLWRILAQYHSMLRPSPIDMTYLGNQTSPATTWRGRLSALMLLATYTTMRFPSLMSSYLRTRPSMQEPTSRILRQATMDTPRPNRASAFQSKPETLYGMIILASSRRRLPIRGSESCSRVFLLDAIYPPTHLIILHLYDT